MKSRVFNPGVVPTQEDFNALSTNVIDALGTFLGALGNSNGPLLFADSAAIVVANGDTLDITVPTQHVASNGIVAVLVEHSESYNTSDPSDEVAGAGPLADYSGKVYCVISQEPVESERNFISAHPTSGTTIKQRLTTPVELVPAARVVIMYEPGSGQSVPSPVLTGQDVGAVEICTFDVSSDVITVTPNVADRFTLPASVSAAITTHGSSHLPDGGDPIPSAALASVPGGSTPGIMPGGAYAAVRGAVQSLSPKSGSEFIKLIVSGSNTSGPLALDPKVVRLGLDLDGSLKKTGTTPSPKLGVSYLDPGTRAGTSVTAARSDHTHASEDAGIIYVDVEIPISSSTPLGSMVPIGLTQPRIPAGMTVDKVMSAQVFWKPQSLRSEFADARIPADWTLLPDRGSSFAGARVIVSGSNQIVLEIATGGCAYLSPLLQSRVQTWVEGGGSVSPTPIAGSLVVQLICRRAV